MSSTFTPSQAVDMSKEKDWPMHLGMLDWDTTKIVFTKRSLVEFLKYLGVTIDPGFANVQKLPRYAEFGNIAASSDPPKTTTERITSIQPAKTGVQGLFEEEEFPDDALATAPRRSDDDSRAGTNRTESDVENTHTSNFKPTRRVRTIPGGTDSIGSMFSDDAEPFVPTRRVRQRPGGADNIEGLF